MFGIGSPKEKVSHQSTSKCPYCNGPSRVRVQAPDINRCISDIEFELRACKSCGLMFVTNPPEDLGTYYKSDYYSVPANAQELEPHLSAQEFKIDITMAFKANGSLLEIGPAIGMFCQLAKRNGFAVSAIELDADCVRFMNEELGVRAVQSSDPAATLLVEGRTYDVICMWHVIEHLAKPWQVLKAAIEHLEPGGILVIAAPNPHAWQAGVLGRNWPHYDLPRHLFQLPMSWLETFAEAAGMTVKLATTRDEGSLYWNRFTWAMLLKRAISWRHGQRFVWQAGLAIGRVLEAWEGAEGRGAAYTMVLQRGPRAPDLAASATLLATGTVGT